MNKYQKILTARLYSTMLQKNLIILVSFQLKSYNQEKEELALKVSIENRPSKSKNWWRDNGRDEGNRRNKVEMITIITTISTLIRWIPEKKMETRVSHIKITKFEHYRCHMVIKIIIPNYFSFCAREELIL